MNERAKSVLQDYSHGLTLDAIARRHGVTQSAVMQIVKKHGKPNRKQVMSKSTKAAIIRMLNDGVSVKRIAEITGYSRGTIYNIRKKITTIDVEKTPSYPTPKNHAGVIALVAGLAMIVVLLLVLAN